jgi:hypothetical protein
MLHSICAQNVLVTIKFFIMPGHDNIDQTRTDKPEANKAAKQKADVDHDGDMEDIDPKYRNEVDKALRKDADSNKHDDNAKTNSDTGGKRRG